MALAAAQAGGVHHCPGCSVDTLNEHGRTCFVWAAWNANQAAVAAVLAGYMHHQLTVVLLKYS